MIPSGRAPSAASPYEAGRAYLEAAHRIVAEILETQETPIVEAARICADAIAGDGLVHCFGTGHSRVLVEELFPRYGSFPGFHPLVELSLTYFTNVVGTNGMRQTMFLERQEGLGTVILDNFQLGRSDAMMVFSSTGVNAVPVEVALVARERGLPVIAVTTLRHAQLATSSHSSGQRLFEIADVVIDNCGVPGDGLVHVPGFGEEAIGPGSTIAGVAAVNAVKVATAAELARRGLRLPVFASDAIVGAERSRELFEAAWAEHSRRVRRL